MKLESVSLDSLTLDPHNARGHDKGIDELVASLKTFEQQKPLVVWQNTVIAGNGLMIAARKLGWTQIQINRVPDSWEYAKAMAYALADNKTAELSEWILPEMTAQLYELEATGWDMPSFGFEALPPPGFPEDPPVPENVVTCPSCGYEWSGKRAPSPK